MSFSSEARFNQVLEDFVSGKLLKEQALEQLESRYKSAYLDIKQQFGKDRQSFCCYVPCDFRKWIEICDGAERNKPFPERKCNDDIIQRVIETYSSKCEKNDLESGDCVSSVYNEVHQIQNWCRENREMTDFYEKCRAEIEVKPDVSIYVPLEDHYFMKVLCEEAKGTYEAVKKALKIGIVEYKNNNLNFKCDKGCVGLFFIEAGYTDFKKIRKFIQINGEECKRNTLENARTNPQPKEWTNTLQKMIFDK